LIAVGVDAILSLTYLAPSYNDFHFELVNNKIKDKRKYCMSVGWRSTAAAVAAVAAAAACRRWSRRGRCGDLDVVDGRRAARRRTVPQPQPPKRSSLLNVGHSSFPHLPRILLLLLSLDLSARPEVVRLLVFPDLLSI